MSDPEHIDDSDLQQDSPAEAVAEVTDPDGQVDEDVQANRIIAAPGPQGGLAVPIADQGIGKE